MERLRKKNIDEWLRYCSEIEQATTETATEGEADKAKRIARLLKNYDAFVQYYFPSVTRGVKNAKFHIEAAEKIAKNKNFRGVFEWARGHAKSTHISLFIPLWLKAKGEFKTMILVGQNEESANRLLSKIQAHLAKNQRYISDFGKQIGFEEWKEGEFTTTDGTKFIAVGRGQSPRGISSDDSFRPDFIVIDDIDDDELVRNPKRVKEVVQWIEGSLFGAMDMGRGRFVMVGNRIGKFTTLTEISQKEGILHSRVNAINENGLPSWGEKYSLAEIEEVRKFQGYFAFEKEYMNNPIEKGNVFQNEWIQWAKTPKLQEFEQIIAYIDPSFKNSTKADYKAVAVVGKLKTKLHLIDCFVRQCSIVQMVSWIYDLHEKLQKVGVWANYYIEASFMQDLFLDDFYEEGEKRGHQVAIIPDKRHKPDKFARIEAISPLFERGWMFFNETKKQNQDFKNACDQLLAFERGSKAHDDFPDALEGAIFLLQQQSKSFSPQAFRLGAREQPEYL